MPPVNTNIYGNKSVWRKSLTAESIPDENAPYLANFTGEMTGTMFSTSSLDTARTKGYLQLNTPIDNSISFIGVDDNCSMVNQKWHKYGVEDTENTVVSMVKKGNNPLVMVSGSYSSATTNGLIIIRPEQKYTAWAYNMEYSTSNPDTKVLPVVKIPTSIVYCIFIRACSKDFDGTSYDSYDIITTDLYTYIHGHTLNDIDSPLYYEDYPNILQIYLTPMYRNDTESVSGDYTKSLRVVPTYSSNNPIYPSILNEIESFTDSDISGGSTFNILRYQQPTKATAHSTFSKGINVFATKPDLRGITLTIDYNSIVLHGLFNLFYNVNSASQKSYYLGICGNYIKTGFLRTSSNVRYFYQYTPISVFGGIEEFENYCLSQTAYLGAYFTESYYAGLQVPELDDEYIYLGIIDDEGITHGEYSQGENNRNQKQWEWNDMVADSPYDPNTPTDPSIYDEETKLVGNTSAGTAFLHVYECTASVINGLKQYLYQIVAPDTTQEELTQKFLTINPIDCITGCYEFPFKVYDDRTPQGNIVIGNTVAHAVEGSDVPLVGRAILNTLRVLDFGSIYYYPFYDDFRDYEPYSEALLYIPYVGYIPISPSEFMGHNIGLKLICDLLTGSCQALVYKDGLVIEASSGNIGTQVPITGIQQADYANSIHSASTRLLASEVSTFASFGGAVLSVATGNIGGVVSSIANAAQAGINMSNAQYELEHTKVPFKQCGIASPNINFANEQQARLILKRPQMSDSYKPSQYGHTVGFACLITAPLSTFTGFTQATNVDLSGIPATVTEKQMIQQQLQSGVYL